MRLSEIAAREDLWGITTRTLEAGWSEQFGRPIVVRTKPFPGAQRWLVSNLLSAIFRPTLSCEVRRVIRDSFRYTPRLLRAPGQWALGTSLALRPVLLRTSSTAFWASAIPGDRDLLILPGNFRVRVLDFAHGRTRSFVKVGFSSAPQQHELALRRENPHGPFPLLLGGSRDGQWLEEELISGYTLPRCPPWWNRTLLESSALRRLDEWLDRMALDVDYRTYVQQLLQSLRELTRALRSRFNAPEVVLGIERAMRNLPDSDCGPLAVSTAHGDLQPGNIMIERQRRSPYLIDWEACAVRHRYFDALTYHLMTRTSPTDLESRVTSFLRGDLLGVGLPRITTAQWRSRMLKLHVAEELHYLATSAILGSFERLPPHAAALIRAWTRVVNHAW